ncbi:MAG: DUF3892 domain-containing protein [Clostridiaceae bacterium]
MKENSHKIEAVVKDNKGEIVGYRLDSGETVDKEKGVSMAKNGEITDVIVSKSKKGEEYLKSAPDGDKSNNLDNLPVDDQMQ